MSSSGSPVSVWGTDQPDLSGRTIWGYAGRCNLNGGTIGVDVPGYLTSKVKSVPVGAEVGLWSGGEIGLTGTFKELCSAHRIWTEGVGYSTDYYDIVDSDAGSSTRISPTQLITWGGYGYQAYWKLHTPSTVRIYRKAKGSNVSEILDTAPETPWESPSQIQAITNGDNTIGVYISKSVGGVTEVYMCRYDIAAGGWGSGWSPVDLNTALGNSFYWNMMAYTPSATEPLLSPVDYLYGVNSATYDVYCLMVVYL